MAKFTDAVRNTLQGHFDAGDQPTEAQFDALILAIQEGIEQHDHDGTGDGDGIQFSTLTIKGDPATLVIEDTGDALAWRLRADGFQLRIDPQSGTTRKMVFQNTGAGDLWVGVGMTPDNPFAVYGNEAADYVAKFINDGDNVNRHGIEVQGGADDGAAVGETIYFAAKDGNNDWTGTLRTTNGVFSLADISDERRKANIVDTKLNGLDIVKGLRVRDFNWKGHTNDPMMTSFIAQEAQKVYPAMVSDFGDGTLGTSRTMLIPILTKAIQELDARLTKGGL